MSDETTVPYRYRAMAKHVVDGDTLDLDVDLGFAVHFNIRVRLYGVNTPELHDKDPEVRAKAVAATERVKVLVFGEAGAKQPPLVVDSYKADAQDKYGRYLARIILPDARCVNDILLTEGLAVPMKD